MSTGGLLKVSWPGLDRFIRQLVIEVLHARSNREQSNQLHYELHNVAHGIAPDLLSKLLALLTCSVQAAKLRNL